MLTWEDNAEYESENTYENGDGCDDNEEADNDEDDEDVEHGITMDQEEKP